MKESIKQKAIKSHSSKSGSLDSIIATETPFDSYEPGHEISIPETIPENESPSSPWENRISKLNPVKSLSFDESSSNQFHRGSRSNKSHKRIAWSWIAAVVDSLIMVSLACFGLICFRFTTGISLNEFLFLVEMNSSEFLWVGMGIIFFYMVIQRIFLGFSIGEWACDLRLGEITQRLSRTYGLKVMFRQTLIMATGFLILPILSLISGYDWAGRISRLPIINKQEN